MDLLLQIDRREMGKMMRKNLGFLDFAVAVAAIPTGCLWLSCHQDAILQLVQEGQAQKGSRNWPHVARAPGCPRMPQVPCLCRKPGLIIQVTQLSGM